GPPPPPASHARSPPDIPVAAPPAACLADAPAPSARSRSASARPPADPPKAAADPGSGPPLRGLPLASSPPRHAAVPASAGQCSEPVGEAALFLPALNPAGPSGRKIHAACRVRHAIGSGHTPTSLSASATPRRTRVSSG